MGIGLEIDTGYHWCSPVTPTNNTAAAAALKQMGRWGTSVVMPSSSQGIIEPGFKDACDRISQVNRELGNPTSGGLDQTVARLYYPKGVSFPNVTAAMAWLTRYGYADSLNYFVGKGGRNVVLFNELNVSTEPQYHIDPRSLAYLAFAINNGYYNDGNRLLYTLFPGPSGLLGYGGGPEQVPFPYSFLGYFREYDFVDEDGLSPRTFGDVYGKDVDQIIANKTMLWHGGWGVFDRISLHCYANNPDEFASAGPDNPALQYISWMVGIDDSWIFITEAGGQSADPASSNFGDSYHAGECLAVYKKIVDVCNDPFFIGRVQAVHGYILPNSDNGATSNGRHKIGPNFIAGYNARRTQLGF